MRLGSVSSGRQGEWIDRSSIKRYLVKPDKTHSMKRILTAAFVILSSVSQASLGAPADGKSKSLGECPFLAQGLAYKMDEYRAFRDKNDARRIELLTAEAKCKDDGAKISAMTATATAGEACKVQGEMAAMNQDISVIGEKCETVFKELNLLQTELEAKFQLVQEDLDEGVEYMNKSAVLKKYCGKRVELANTMAKAFVKLEGEVVFVKTRSLAGKVDYGKFKEAAQQLKTITAAANKNCGDANLTTADGSKVERRTASHTYGQGSGTAAKKGKGGKDESDVSGVKKALEDQKKADAILNAPAKP